MLERGNIQVLAKRLVIFCHIYKIEGKSFSTRAVFQRLIANCTNLANCTISNFEFFKHQIAAYVL